MKQECDLAKTQNIKDEKQVLMWENRRGFQKANESFEDSLHIRNSERSSQEHEGRISFLESITNNVSKKKQSSNRFSHI